MLPDDLAAPIAELRSRHVNVDVHWHDSLPSTMDLAASLAEEGAGHGVVVAADAQTAGRGRRGNAWSSPPSAGLYFSFIAKPRVPTLSLLTLAAGLGVRDGIITSTGLATDLKWPNDVLVGRRKLAGILAEGFGLATRQPTVVIGVGINMRFAAYPPDVSARATSLEGELGRDVDRGLLFAGVLEGLWDRFASLEQDPDGILQAWRAASRSAVGTRVDWDGHHGITAGIDDSGALLISTAAGTERIISGELHWTLS